MAIHIPGSYQIGRCFDITCTARDPSKPRISVARQTGSYLTYAEMVYWVKRMTRAKRAPRTYPVPPKVQVEAYFRKRNLPHLPLAHPMMIQLDWIQQLEHMVDPLVRSDTRAKFSDVGQTFEAEKHEASREAMARARDSRGRFTKKM